ncbi:alpha/beta hydrolase [Microbulbifer sp. MLAF003]|uniref:alpha/beta fold hydrolase n=1 Tax=unclassified Microbulbifer TaxID=2619833 RepID=UPI0024ACDB93|nr:alpha/beta hydrolase [Microbulbifer sp. MLAF003]WHI49526.1 alpha/beta hydrolase [Microbulbifer sp. MLAF003]
MIKKTALTVGTLLLLLGLSCVVWVITVPPLPEAIEQRLQRTLNQPLPHLASDDSGFVRSGDINIWYQLKAPAEQPVRGTVLLINGLGSSSLYWPPKVYEPLLAAGYQVLLTDNRGCGASSRVHNWSKEAAYDLSDMMQDNIEVMNTLGIQQAHVMGASMGGMIAQEMALQHPARLKSLSSIMSSGYVNDPELPVEHAFKYSVLRLFLRYGLSGSEEGMVRLMASTYHFLQGQGGFDVEHITRTTLYELRHRKGFDPQLPTQQATAISLSGSRLQRLEKLEVPTLVIHGDKDPLLDIAHAKKYAARIPNVKTLWVDGMGHAMAPVYVETWMEEVLEFLDTNN